MESVSLFSETRVEYLKQMSMWLIPPLVEFFRNEYNSIKKDDETVAMAGFQKYCSEIPKWNQDIIDANVAVILDSCHCDYIEELMTAVFIAHTKMLTAIRVNSRNKKLQITLPKLDHFLHRVFIECARSFWKSPYIFSDEFTPIERQKNILQAEAMCTEALSGAVRSLLPVKSILKDYLEDDEEPVEEPKLVKKPIAKHEEKPIVKRDEEEESESLPHSGGGEEEEEEEEELEAAKAEVAKAEAEAEVAKAEAAKAEAKEEAAKEEAAKAEAAKAEAAKEEAAKAEAAKAEAAKEEAAKAEAAKAEAKAEAAKAEAAKAEAAKAEAEREEPVKEEPSSKHDELEQVKEINKVVEVRSAKTLTSILKKTDSSTDHIKIDTEPMVHFTPYDTVFDHNASEISEIRYTPEFREEDTPSKLVIDDKESSIETFEIVPEAPVDMPLSSSNDFEELS